MSRCEQLMAAGGPQMLSPTSIRGRNLVTCLTILGVEMQAVEVDAQKTSTQISAASESESSDRRIRRT